MRVAWLIVTAAAALAGCSSDPRPGCGFIGDPGQPLEVEVMALGANLLPELLVDGSRVPLFQPPQGGFVLYVGLHARNLDSCAVQIVGALRDPTSQAVIGLEGRPVAVAASGDGWVSAATPTEPSSYANVAVCPNQRSDRDIDEQPYQLLVTVTDGGGRMGSGQVDVTPACADGPDGDSCRCLCRTGYHFGDPCPGPDAGT